MGKSRPQSAYHNGSYKTKNTCVAEPREAKGKGPTETNKQKEKTPTLARYRSFGRVGICTPENLMHTRKGPDNVRAMRGMRAIGKYTFLIIF